MSKYNLPLDNILTRLMELRSRIPNRKYRLYEPPDRYLSDIISIQDEAKDIMKFLGIYGYSVIVSFGHEDSGTAGHIDLSGDEGNTLFINIDNKVRGHNAEILAVLAHEICHIITKEIGLTMSGPLQFENEIYTDLTTIYMGLGLLSLNGCYNELSSPLYSGHTIRKYGYLTYETFVKSFLLVNILEGKVEYNHSSSLYHYAKQTIETLESSIPTISSEQINLVAQNMDEEIARKVKYVSMIEHYLHLQKLKIQKECFRNNRLKAYVDNGRITDTYSALDAGLHLEGDINPSSFYREMMFLIADHDKILFDGTSKKICPSCLHKFQDENTGDGIIMSQCPHCGERFLWDNTSFNTLQLSRENSTKTKPKKDFWRTLFHNKK